MNSASELELMPLLAARLWASTLKISTDTRTLGAGDVFFALRGENFDGHDFIKEAAEKGASLVLAERLPESFSAEALIVPDSLKAYQLLARTYRRLLNPLVIGITGSNGKTTTKEMLRRVLENTFRLHYSPANLNNQIGVPQSILAMPPDTEVLILEMGMRGLGQIEELSLCAEPNISIITNIGSAHIELLGSRENIKKAKLEIVSGMKSRTGSKPVLIVDQQLASELNLAALEILSFDDKARYQIQGLTGSAIHSDANAMAVAARYLGLSEEQIQKGLNHYSPSRGRGSFHRRGEHLIIDDTYNASPESVRASVQALLQQYPDTNKILALGDIQESDPSLIEDLILGLKAKPELKFLDLRSKTIDESYDLVREQLVAPSVILVKASRAMRFERLVDVLMTKL